MLAKLLCLLALAATAAAGAAAAQTSRYPEVFYPDSRTLGPLPVFAVIGHHVVSGEVRPRESLLPTLVDARQPTFSCEPSQRGREITLSCSDGSSAKLKLDHTACGRTRGGEPASMCIGLKAKYAARRLTAPAGKTLRIDGGRLVLEPVAGD